MRALAIAATGMAAQQTNVEVIANNIANINTTALQARPRRIHRPALPVGARCRACPTAAATTSVPEGAQIGLGVRTAAIRNLHMQGALTRPATSSTWRSTGAAGSRSTGADGETLYTRAGAFNTNATGQLVTVDGYAVASGDHHPGRRGRGHRQRDPARSTRASTARPALQLLGQLTLANFANEAGLEPLGGNLYRETAASGPPIVGVARRPRLRHDPAGLSRKLQRRSGQGDHRADLRAARLRDELQGHPGRRRDGAARSPRASAERMPRSMLRAAHRLLARASAAAVARCIRARPQAEHAAGRRSSRSIPGEAIKRRHADGRDLSPPARRDAATVVDCRDGLVGKVARRTLLPGKPIPLQCGRRARARDARRASVQRRLRGGAG